MNREYVHGVPADVYQGDASVLPQFGVIAAQCGVALRKYLAFRDPAAVRPALELKRNVVPQELLAERIFPRPVAVDGKSNAENDLCIGGSGLVHGLCNSRKG